MSHFAKAQRAREALHKSSGKWALRIGMSHKASFEDEP